MDELLLLALFHMLDMTFTVLLIEKIKKYSDIANPEDVEFNYHRYFFKKFGLWNGALKSMCISLPVVVTLGYVALAYYSAGLYYFLVGIQFGVMWINFISWYNYDTLQKRLERKNG